MPAKKRKAAEKEAKDVSDEKPKTKKRKKEEERHDEEIPEEAAAIPDHPVMASLPRPNYWLFKSSTKSNIRKETETKYSIEDLMEEAEQSTSWAGVRNAESAKLIRLMRPGDMVLFYHSNCRDPGFVGIVSVISEPYIDPTQLDPKSPYYDERSTKTEPRWVTVDIKFFQQFKRTVSRKELKKCDVEGSPLHNMRLLRLNNHMAVDSITPAQYDYILQLADQD